MISRLGTKRIEIGDEMAAHAVSVDELQYRSFLSNFVKLRSAHAWHGHRPICFPMHRFVWNLQMRKNLFVEIFLALQQFLQPAQEHTGFRALNHAMVVGAGNCHYLAKPQHGPQLLGDAAIFRRIVDSAGGNNRALSGHQPWNGAKRANRARVRQRNS